MELGSKGENYAIKLSKNWNNFLKLKLDLPYDPAIWKAYMWVSILQKYQSSSFTIAKTGPRHSLTDELIKKMVYIHKMVFYSAIKKPNLYHLQEIECKGRL